MGTSETDGAESQLPYPLRQRWGWGGFLTIFGLLGMVVGVIGIVELITQSSSLQTGAKIAFVVVIVLCLLLGAWLVRTGINVARHLTGLLPALYATATVVRLERPGRKPREVGRQRLAAAVWEARDPVKGETPIGYLEWQDADGRSLGTWTVNPVVEWGLGAFLDTIEVDLTILEPEPLPLPEPESDPPAAAAPDAAAACAAAGSAGASAGDDGSVDSDDEPEEVGAAGGRPRRRLRRH